MENAARNCVDIIRRKLTGGCILLVCGGGNNGGDGFAMARLLATWGFKPHVALLVDPEKLTGDAAVNWKIVQALELPVSELWGRSSDEIADFFQSTSADGVVDAMLGTGTRLPLREPFVTVIEQLNRRRDDFAIRLAVDLPSGLEADGKDRGEESNEAALSTDDRPVFQADTTVTFVARKPVMNTRAGLEFCGLIHVVDIGAPHQLLNHI